MSLTDKINKMLFEDTWNRHGSEYMSHPFAQEDHTTTIQPELPIAPSAHADMQLTDTAPPVEDEEYVPANSKELGSALVALVSDLPHDRVEQVYLQVKDMANAIKDESPAEQEPSLDDSEIEGLDEALSKFLKGKLHESRWDDDDPRYDDDDLDDPELDADGNYTGASPDEIPLKYLAQYYRDKPGSDPDKIRGSGETTVVNATGRLMQNVIRPLYDVPKADLADAVEYLRLQFGMLAKEEFGMEKWPAEAPKTFQGLYFKKLVPKLDEDQLGANFLATVVNDFKRRNKRWLKDMVEKTLAEVESERAAHARLKKTLEKEAPHLAKIW